MTFKEQVLELINQALIDKPTVFLIDLLISDSNKITVLIDGDSGVLLQDCIDISRSIENNLDREEQDFSLEVASVGVGSVLKTLRQYYKNVGRTLIVKTIAETIEAELVEVTMHFTKFCICVCNFHKKAGSGWCNCTSSRTGAVSSFMIISA